MSQPALQIARRVREALNDIQRVAQRAQELRDKAIRTNDDGYWDGVALNLHGFYAGIEHVFEDIAQTLDVNIPTGAQWHRDLLLQMADAIPDVRPAVITRDSLQCLDELRAFRHIVRNVYTFNLRPSRLQELVDLLPVCSNSINADLRKFIAFLERLGQSQA